MGWPGPRPRPQGTLERVGDAPGWTNGAKVSEPQPHAHWALISYAIGMGILSCLSLAVGPGAASPQLVVFAAAVALACWGLTLTGLRIDPLALFRTYTATASRNKKTKPQDPITLLLNPGPSPACA